MEPQNYFAIDFNALITGVVAIASSLITLIFTNRANYKNLRSQLEHTERLQANSDLQRDKERKWDLRQSIYLEATAETQLAIAALARLPAKQIDQNTDQEIAGFFRSIAKAKLVAEVSTGAAIQELQDTFGEIYMWMLGQATTLHKMRLEGKDIDEALEKNAELHQKLRTLEEGEGRQKLGRLLKEDQVNLENDQNLLRADIGRCFNAVLPEFTEKFELFLPAQSRALYAVRIELGIESDLEQIELETKRSFKKAFGLASEIIERM